MNSYSDPTETINSYRFPNTVVKRCSQNLGYAGGNNWGLQFANGEFILIINNDTIITPSTIAELLNPLLNNKTVGIVCPKILYYTSPNIIQYGGYSKFNFYRGCAKSIANHKTDSPEFNKPETTHLAHGCAIMTSKSIIQKTGAFPKEFFLYYEEFDWSLRVLKTGFSIFYQPKSTVLHRESVSVGKNSPTKIFYQTRNRILLMRRHATSFQFSIFLLYLTIAIIPISTIRFIFKGNFNLLKPFFSGILWNLNHGHQCTTNIMTNNDQDTFLH